MVNKNILNIICLIQWLCAVTCIETGQVAAEIDVKETSIFANGLTYKSYVGPLVRYDRIGASQFALLTFLGLRAHHTLLDFGCGSLRAGRLFIPYLDKSNYYCVEPNTELINEGFRQELGTDIIEIKDPHISNDTNFNPRIFNRKFDFVLCQSIFSHTGRDLAKHLLSGIKDVLNMNSAALVTFYLAPPVPYESLNVDGKSMIWVYPGNSMFTIDEIFSMITEVGLFGASLQWEHPEQHWVVIARTIDKAQWVAKMTYENNAGKNVFFYDN